MWFKLGKTASRQRSQASTVVCPACVRLKCDLHRQMTRTRNESPSRKKKRHDPSSSARLSYMSPNSQLQRHKKKVQRDSSRRKLRQYDHMEVPLDNDQDEEMTKVVSTIEQECSVELELLFSEGDKHGVGSRMREIWNADKRSKDVDEFRSDQCINSKLVCILLFIQHYYGCIIRRSNKWSTATIRMGIKDESRIFTIVMIFFIHAALAIYTRSPAAYEALKSFAILQLPCRSTLQAYTGAFLHEPGANSDSIADQVARYLLHCQERMKEGKLESQKDGVLIFDEVKVISRMMWNSRSQKVMGLCMNHVDLSSLSDVYQMLDDDVAHQTCYILQFLWRDLTSDYDIIGPYFTCSKSLEAKFIISCVLETVKLFQLHSLKTSIIVCDGASSNLSAIKASHNHYGAYTIQKGFFVTVQSTIHCY